MRCNNCPLFESYHTENEASESCAIFGDDWSSPFMYEDKEGTVIGCYIERAYINKVDKEISEHYDKMADGMAKMLENEKKLELQEIF